MAQTKGRTVKSTQAQASRPGSITFSISCQIQDKDRMDSRARALGMDRSAYLVALARQDMVRDGEFVMVPEKDLRQAEKVLAGDEAAPVEAGA